MESITLNFYGEIIKISKPENLLSLKKEISEKFLFSLLEVDEIIISYLEESNKNIINSEEDYNKFKEKNITQIDLDISPNSQIYQSNLESLQNETKNIKEKIEELSAKSNEIKEKKKMRIEEGKKEIENINNQLKELNKKRTELIKPIDEEIKKLRVQEKQKQKELKQDLKKYEKEELIIMKKISIAQKSYNTFIEPIKTLKTETNNKESKIVGKKKLKLKEKEKEKKKKRELKALAKKEKKKENRMKSVIEKRDNIFREIKVIINKMITKVNFSIKSIIENEFKEIENIEKKVSQSCILLKDEDKESFIKIRKIGENSLEEINKWSQFIVNHTNELIENLEKKHEEIRKPIIQIEEQLKQSKLDEKQISHSEIIEPKMEELSIPFSSNYSACNGCGMELNEKQKFKCETCENFVFCENCQKTKQHQHQLTKINES